MNLPIVALCLVSLLGAAVWRRAGALPGAAFVAVGCAMVSIQGSMIPYEREAFPLPPLATLAFLASPLLPALLAAILVPRGAGR